MITQPALNRNLASLRRHQAAIIAGFAVAQPAKALQDSAQQLERRLRQYGLSEGMRVEILHESPLGRGALVIRAGRRRLALCRLQAQAIMVAA